MTGGYSFLGIFDRGVIKTGGHPFLRHRNNKDFVIGGLFAVREDDAGHVCGKPRRDQWAEAMLFAIE